MKKAFLSVLLFSSLTANADDPVPRPPVIVRPSNNTSPVFVDAEEKSRFQAVENTGGTGFYWLDTTDGDLWRLDPATMEWNFCGSPRGANSARKGTYQLLPDRNGGVYVLDTDNGEGWWTDGTVWKTIGDPSRRVKKPE